jgi:hypothetical protein
VNPLFVQFENDLVIYTFYVNMHCTLSEAIADIEKETRNKVINATYKRV